MLNLEFKVISVILMAAILKIGHSRFLIIDNHVKNKQYGNFVSISSLTGKCAAQKLKKNYSSSLWTCLHHMVILRSQNKITDFLMILDLGLSL